MPDLSQVVSFCLLINITREAYDRCAQGEKGRRKSGRWLADHFLSLSSLSFLSFPFRRCCNSLPRPFLAHLQMIVVVLIPNNEMHEMFCHFVFLHGSNTVLDPDLEIRWEGPGFPQNFFGLFRPQFGPKIRRGEEGGARPSPSPGFATATQPCRKGSWLPSFLLAIILYYWCHFLNITTVLQIWSMLHVAYYE